MGIVTGIDDGHRVGQLVADEVDVVDVDETVVCSEAEQIEIKRDGRSGREGGNVEGDCGGLVEVEGAAGDEAGEEDGGGEIGVAVALNGGGGIGVGEGGGAGVRLEGGGIGEGDFDGDVWLVG